MLVREERGGMVVGKTWICKRPTTTTTTSTTLAVQHWNRPFDDEKTQFAKQATHIQQIFLAHVSWALRSECGWPPLVTGHFVDHLLLLYNPDPPLVLLDQALSKIIFTILLWGEAERTIRSCNQYVWQWLETSWNIRMLRLKSATKQNA